MIDKLSPTIIGSDITTYTNNANVTLQAPTCHDNYAYTTSSSTQCDIYYKVGDGSYNKYSKSVSLRLNGDTVVYYKAIDRVGNESSLITHTYILDVTAPLVEVVLSPTVKDDYSSCGDLGTDCMRYQGEIDYTLDSTYKLIHLLVSDASGQITSKVLARFDGSIFVTIPFEEDITEAGLYNVVVTDRAGNVTTVEFFVHKEVYDESGSKIIDIVTVNADSSEDIVLKYRELYLIEYDLDDQTILYNEDVFSKITKNDGVYVAGINELGKYVRLVKYNGSDLYNTVSGIKANSVGISDSLIEIDGNYYLMMIMVDNDTSGPIEDDTTQDDSSSGGDNGGGTSFTWIFYILGIIGVLGGGFLVIKLRNKVRAA